MQPNDNGIDDTAEQQYANFNCYPRGSALPNTCPNKPANQPLYDPVNKCGPPHSLLWCLRRR